MTKHRFLATCTAAAFVLSAGQAYAQDAQASDATETTPAGASPATTPDDQTPTQDIIVTAQGRAQVLADVPLAITAVSAASLERSGANDIRQLTQIAPSLLVSSTGNEANGSARLRGIGTVGDNPGLESSVAVFVDGVYRSRSGIGLNELGDIERVEVLRGPQGTLFGRNASAGILSIVSKSPSLSSGFTGGGEATYGNYDAYRFAGNLNVPLGESLAARVDGVYSKRDGFYDDKTNNTDVNDRNRYFIRGQLLFQPSSDLTVRLIGDYTHRDEACCGAVFLDQTTSPYNKGLLTTTNPIIPVLLNLGQPSAALTNPFSRDLYVSPGRTYEGITEDYGVSGQIDYDFGNVNLTSISAYRHYNNNQAGDVDYSYVDILYRAPGDNAGAREFDTYSQELRLQGKLFNDRIDWLVGGYYGNETLETRENLSFGRDYGRFAACRLLASGALSPFQDATQTGCLSTAGRFGVFPSVFGAAAPTLLSAIDRLDTLRSLGNTGTVFRQKERNFAFFTHNIVHIVDGLDLTLGLRYTNEQKKLNARFANNNTVCPQQQAALIPFLTNPGLAAVAGGIIGLSCQGNSTSELDGQTLRDKRNEDEFTGTAILSYKITPDTLIYGSYARGYKAGGFNLDGSALKSPILPFAAVGGAQALSGNLQFDPEINNAFEIGAKYSGPNFSLNIAGFHQAFDNFQLNTFNGTVFLVQNVNSCSTGLNGGDADLSATTGSCASGDVKPGVISQGVELEATFSPARNFTVSSGFTYADTHFRKDLVGNANGAPLDPALRVLPSQQLSNAPKAVVTTAVTWTPEIGSTGYSALFYADNRLSSDYNTGSDKFYQKAQDGFFLVNARVGIRAPEERFAIEFWAQNVFNKDYTQVAFNTPFVAGPGVGVNPNFPAATYPGGTQTFSAFLAEPRTYGVTLRGKF